MVEPIEYKKLGFFERIALIKQMKKVRKIIKTTKEIEKQEWQYKKKLIETVLTLSQIFEYTNENDEPITSEYLIQNSNIKDLEETIENSLIELEKMI